MPSTETDQKFRLILRSQKSRPFLFSLGVVVVAVIVVDFVVFCLLSSWRKLKWEQHLDAGLEKKTGIRKNECLDWLYFSKNVFL